MPIAAAANAGSADAQIAIEAASLNDAIETMFDIFVIQRPPARTNVNKSWIIETTVYASIMIIGLYCANHNVSIKTSTSWTFGFSSLTSIFA